jgi:hypothetical protein
MNRGKFHTGGRQEMNDADHSDRAQLKAELAELQRKFRDHAAKLSREINSTEAEAGAKLDEARDLIADG